MKADEPRQNRIPFMMSDAELSAVDDWRFANKIGTRAEAIRRLCQIGLAYDREAGSSRELTRAAIKSTLAGLNRFLDVSSNLETDQAREVLAAMEEFQESAKTMISLFQDMATTDSTATAMEEAGEFSQQLRKATESKATIDARRK